MVQKVQGHHNVFFRDHPEHGIIHGTGVGVVASHFPAPDHIYHALIAFRAALIVANGV